MAMNKKIPRIILFNIILTGVLAGFLELGYRKVLNAQTAKPETPYYFFACNKAMLQEDPELGYSYTPDHASCTAIVKTGSVVRLYLNRINRWGIPGREDVVDPAAAVKILVVGDSFTALPYVDVSWPDVLHDRLEEKGLDVSVWNAGRDGYGLLQMLHAARLNCQTSTYDHIVFAFISDDFTRDRFWRYDLQDLVPPRVITSTVKNRAELEPPYVDSYLLEPEITEAWIHRMLADMPGQQEDPLLARMINEVIRRKQTYMTLPLLNPGFSAIWNKIAHQDPYWHLSRKGRNPRHSHWRFSEDPQAEEDLEFLLNSRIPISLIHLPELRELKNKGYIMTPQTEALLRDLESRVGVNALDLDAFFDIPEDELSSYYLTPYDHHPNAEGMRKTGQVVADLLVEHL